MDAVRVGVAGGVEPVAAAVLAPVRRRQQPVDVLLVGVGRLVVDERLDVFRAGRQAGEVERQAAGEGAAVGLGGGGEAFLLRARQDERVDRVADPGFVGYNGNLRADGGATNAQC